MVQHFIIWWLGGLETLVTVGCGYMLCYTALLLSLKELRVALRGQMGSVLMTGEMLH